MAGLFPQVIQNLQGLQGLEQGKMRMDQYKSQQADLQEASTALQDYYKTGNQQSLINATLKSPQLAGQMLTSLGLDDERKQQQAATELASLWQLRSNPEQFKKAALNRVESIMQRGGVPSDTINLMMTYDKNPAQAEELMRVAGAALEANGYKTGIFEQQEKKSPYQQGTGDAVGFVFDPNTGTYTANQQVIQAIESAKARVDENNGKIDAKTVITLNDKVGGITKDADMIYNTANDISKLRKIGGGPASISIVYKFMKSLDPTSVVREGEFATAANAGGVPDNIANIYNRLINGERLPESVIADFEKTAQSLSDSAATAAEQSVYKYLDTFEGQLPDSLKEKLKARVPKKFGVKEDEPKQVTQAPQQAIDYLRQNPQLKEQFKAKYGYIPEGL